MMCADVNDLGIGKVFFKQYIKSANHKKVNKLQLIKTSIKKTSSRKQIGKDLNLEYVKNHK